MGGQPRHPKGTREGGKWASKPSAEDTPTSRIRLEDLQEGAVHPDELPRTKFILKLAGKQRTYKVRDNPSLNSPLWRKFRKGEHTPTPYEALDVGSAVVAEMLNNGCSDIDDNSIIPLGKEAVRGAYASAINRQTNTELPALLRKVRGWSPQKAPYKIASVEAFIRGMALGAELGTYGNETADDPKARAARGRGLRLTLRHFNGLAPFHTQPEEYMGDNGTLIHRTMNLPSCVEQNQTVMDFIVEQSKKGWTDKKADDLGLFLVSTMEPHAYAQLSLYLLGTTDPHDPLHEKSLKCLDFLLTSSDKKIAMTVEGDLDEAINVVNHGLGTESYYMPRRIDHDIYDKAVRSLVRARTTHVGRLVSNRIFVKM